MCRGITRHLIATLASIAPLLWALLTTVLLVFASLLSLLLPPLLLALELLPRGVAALGPHGALRRCRSMALAQGAWGDTASLQ